MKIASVEVVNIDFPKVDTSKSRRHNANHHATRAFPINKYPEFSNVHTRIPGAVPGDFWVKITAEDGTWGLGQGSWGAAGAAVVEHTYAPMLMGRDAMATELLADMLWRASQRQGQTGVNSFARSAIDLALWDLKGKLLQQPVYALLGGPVRERIDCYCTSDDLDWALELGFQRFKVSNPVHYDQGQVGLQIIEEHIARAREAVGERELMFNPVMSFNVDYAVKVAERLRPYQLRWIEDPLMPWDTRGMRELRQRTPYVSWATGENHHGRHVFRELLELRAVDVIQPDIRWCGGLTELMKIYTVAEAFGVQTIPHFGANNAFGQHFHLAAPEAPMAEYWMGSDPGIPLEDVMTVPGVATPKDGSLTVSDAPGFGLDVPESWMTTVARIDEGFR